jgi:hypothetical protein
MPVEDSGQTGPDIVIHVVEDEIALCGDQRGQAQKREIRGPHVGTICLRLRDADEAAATAVVCHAWGEEMDSRCTACKDGPFDQCVALPDRFHNACSNCILMGRERSCDWWTRYDRDSDKDYGPPKKRRANRTGSEGRRPTAKRHKDSTPEEPADLEAGKKVLSAFIDLTGD